MLRLAQWDWLRMKVRNTPDVLTILLKMLHMFQCTTLQYISTLGVCCASLKEIIEILSPIRADSVEGANGLKVSGDCHDEHEFDWFSHLHCGGSGKKGDSLLQIHQRVDTLPATLSSTILFPSYLCY